MLAEAPMAQLPMADQIPAGSPPPPTFQASWNIAANTVIVPGNVTA